MRVLICGTRRGCEKQLLLDAFAPIFAERILQHIEIVTGDATGIDTMAQELAIENDMKLEVYPADWALGKKAGPLRNQRMIDSRPDLVLAFPDLDSVGTWDTIRRSVRANIPVRVFPVRVRAYPGAVAS